MQVNLKNERIKRRYLKWLREAKGYSEMTIRSIEQAIWQYEDFTQNANYMTFNQSKAVGFKKWLEARIYRGRPISITTAYHYLRHLRDFFVWLSGQPGYKSRISLDNVSYLSLDRKKVREATAPRQPKFPSLEYVKKLVSSIEVHNEIDQRDRALVAFLLLSGMRDKAIITLPLGCFNRESLQISQDTKRGVDTKFGKSFVSTLLRFDDKLTDIVIKWSEYLEKEKMFGSADPLFPRSKIQQVKDGFSFEAKEVEPIFWRGTGSLREILKVRAGKTGVEYHRPHSFRHAAVHLAMKFCRTAEEIKAVSQNLGHENIGTTLMTYGTLDQFRVAEVIRNTDFSAGPQDTNNHNGIKLLEHLLDRLKKKR